MEYNAMQHIIPGPIVETATHRRNCDRGSISPFGVVFALVDAQGMHTSYQMLPWALHSQRNTIMSTCIMSVTPCTMI